MGPTDLRLECCRVGEHDAFLAPGDGFKAAM
jgi:hypothetical protein